MTKNANDKPEKSEFIDALKKGALLGIAILVVVIPSMRIAQKQSAPQPQSPVATVPALPAPGMPPDM